MNPLRVFRAGPTAVVAAAALAVAFLSIPRNGTAPGPAAEPPAAERPATVRGGEAAPPDRSRETTSVRLYGEWRSYTTRDGLPADKVHSVHVQGDRVWAGTDAGVAYLEDGRWHTLTEEDGLAHPVVLTIDANEETGAVWFGTLGGLTRWSAGRMETYDQLNSGLVNDVVYRVRASGRHVWAATAAGASRLDVYTDDWEIYTQENVPLHEPWTYGVSVDDGKAWIAAWAGGVLEYDLETGRWRDYRDPDGEMELDLFPDDGLVHDVTSSISYEDGILWVGTYFGLSRYDGTRWRTYFEEDSGLASNFINFVRARGNVVWVCTDRGLSAFDGEVWVTYRSEPQAPDGELVVSDGERTIRREPASAPAHGYVNGMDFQGERVWVATSDGLSVGTASRIAAALIDEDERATGQTEHGGAIR